MGPLAKLHGRLVAGARSGLEREGQAPELHERDAASILAMAGAARARGLWLRPFLGACGRGLMVAAGAKVRHAHRVRLGSQVKLEAGCEVHGLAAAGVVLGDRVTVGRGASIRPSGYYGTDLGAGLQVGDRTAIGPFSWIGASGSVSIGSDVLLGPRVVILPENHVFTDTERPIAAQGVERAAVRIEDNCWLGADVKVLAGVTIHTGCIVAAGAVVRQDLPPYTIAAGVPARVVRHRAPSRSQGEAA